jgi:hypothetical protein
MEFPPALPTSRFREAQARYWKEANSVWIDFSATERDRAVEYYEGLAIEANNI